MDFTLFTKSLLKKLLKSQIFRILEPLVDFIFNFEVCKLERKTLKKLSLNINSLEIEFEIEYKINLKFWEFGFEKLF